MRVTKQSLLLLGLVACLLGLMQQASAQTSPSQSWPSQTITIIVPYAAGGASDAVARILGAALQDRFGKQVIIENRGGAGGSLGSTAASKSAPDGHTLLFTPSGPPTINHLIYKDKSIDFERDLEPVLLIADSSFAIVSHPSLPIKSMAELVTYAKANPRKLTVGLPGIGTMPHAALELLKSKVGIEMLSVPYRGTALVINDIIAGHIQLSFDSLGNFVGGLTQNSLQALAVTTATRAQLFPDVPTVKESQVPELADYEASGWVALWAPAGTPSEVVGLINAALNDFIASEDGRKKLVALTLQPRGGKPDVLRTLLRREIAKWSAIVQSSRMTAQ